VLIFIIKCFMLLAGAYFKYSLFVLLYLIFINITGQLNIQEQTIYKQEISKIVHIKSCT